MFARTGVVLVALLASALAVAGFVLRHPERIGPEEIPDATTAKILPFPRAERQDAPKVEPPPPVNRMRAALTRVVSFPGLDDPKATLQEVLNQIAKQWQVKFAVVGKDAEDLLKAEVANPNAIPPATRKQADLVLWSILERVPAGYRASEDVITIARKEWFTEHGVVPEQPDMDTPRMAAEAKALREKLSKVVDFPGLDDPKATLVDVLDTIGRRWGVEWVIDEHWFKYEMLNDVAKQEVANPNAIPPMRTQLYYVFDRILARVPIPSGSAFAVRGKYIWISTGQGFFASDIAPEPPPKPTTKMRKQFVDSRGALLRTISFAGVDDPKATLIDVLDRLAKQSEIVIDVQERDFKFFMINDVLKEEIANRQLIPPIKAPLAKVLDVVLERISLPGPGVKATYVVRQGGIVVVVSTADLFHVFSPGG